MSLENSPGRPENEERARPSNLTEILQARRPEQSSVVDRVKGLRIGGSSTAGQFLTCVDIPPGSQFGQFVTLRHAEAVVTTEVTILVGRIGKKGVPRDIKEQAMKAREYLQLIRGVRKEVGEEIFADEAEEYAKKVIDNITRGPTGRNSGEQRSKWQNEFADEVKKSFPNSCN